jgi:ParB-like chromosome segregation protein Spo0J
MTGARRNAAFDAREIVGETVAVPIGDLSPGVPVRSAGVDEGHVKLLMETAGQWPPVLATRGGCVIDGTHRLIAARRAGLPTLSVSWFDGTGDEAFVEAVRRNVTHGLPLSFDDRVEAVQHLLQSHRDWSDRRIARICAVAPRTVAQARFMGSSAPGQASDKRLGMDGRRRPAKGAADRTRILHAIENEPDRSLRSIASEVGVSPETVRSVRATYGSVPRSSPPQGDLQGREARHSSNESDNDAMLSRLPHFVDDPAFGSQPDRRKFAVWFDAMAVSTNDSNFICLVPLGRVYEVADEARRRAMFWTSFADELESHARV